MRFVHVFIGAWLGLCGTLLGTTFTNSAAIIIPTGGTASPYPSVINVVGLTGTITSVSVTLHNFSHTWPDDVGVLLESPTGAAFLIQTGAGDDPDMVDVTYTLSDSGASFLPDLAAWTAGTYKPTAHYTGDAFPGPAPGTINEPGPAGSGATFASVFNGLPPNGMWKLYVNDFLDDFGGQFAGGWSIDITSAIPEPSSALLLLSAATLLFTRRRA